MAGCYDLIGVKEACSGVMWYAVRLNDLIELKTPVDHEIHGVESVCRHFLFNPYNVNCKPR